MRLCSFEILKGAYVNNEKIGIVEDNPSLSAIYKETSSVVELSMLMSRITQVYLIWDFTTVKNVACLFWDTC